MIGFVERLQKVTKNNNDTLTPNITVTTTHVQFFESSLVIAR
jgi:hypothetical protein